MWKCEGKYEQLLFQFFQFSQKIMLQIYFGHAMLECIFVKMTISLPYKLCKCVHVWDRVHPSVLPCAASGDMCWWERLWIWCLYAYTASTNTMMHPIMPPATGPTGALLIMFRDATSSSAEGRERENGEERTGRRCLKHKGFQSSQEGTTSQPEGAQAQIHYYYLISVKWQRKHIHMQPDSQFSLFLKKNNW